MPGTPAPAPPFLKFSFLFVIPPPAAPSPWHLRTIPPPQILVHVLVLSLIQRRGSLLLQPDGAISQEPDGGHLFSWCHPRCRALTQGETNNLASLPLTQLCEPAGGALVLLRDGGGGSPACCTVREIEARPCVAFQNGK